MQAQNLVEWIALAEALGPRSTSLSPLLAHFGTPEAIFLADEAALRATLPTASDGTVKALLSPDREAAARILDQCRALGISVITPADASYPNRLREIGTLPAVIYVQGKLSALDAVATVGMVGARHCTAYGEGQTYKISYELAAKGVTVVSGMAEGIDAVAAAAAIEAGGVTVAFLGCGLDIDYPKQNAVLRKAILEKGALVSEYPPGTLPRAPHFPIRNRLIAALSDVVAVTEATARSGGLITARYAISYGKQIFALPGDVDKERSAGTNSLLHSGAKALLTLEDILSALPLPQRDESDDAPTRRNEPAASIRADVMRRFGLPFVGGRSLLGARLHAEEKPKPKKKRKRGAKEREVSEPSTPPSFTALDTQSATIFMMLPDTPFTVDVLVANGVTAAEATAALTTFEIYGLITAKPGGLYQKCLYHG